MMRGNLIWRKSVNGVMLSVTAVFTLLAVSTLFYILGYLVYYGSQSWPFPHSLMVAYTARWVIGEIVPQNVFPVGEGHADALHHVDHRQGPEQGLQRIGFDDGLG